MARGMHRHMRMLLSAALVLTGIVFVPAAGDVAIGLEADDVLPGLALEDITGYSATATGTLNPPPTTGTADSWDIYSVYLAEGEQLVVTLEGTGADFDLRLWAPSTVDPMTPKTVYSGFTVLGSSNERICYTASAKWGTGRYYVVVDASDSGAGAGSYVLRWNVSSRSDGNVPGVALTTASVTDTVDTVWDLDDVYRFEAGSGGTLSATLTADSPLADLKLQLIDAKVGSEIVTDIYAAVSPVQDSGSVAVIEWTLADVGVYYLDVVAEDEEMAGYTLEWSYSGTVVPEAGPAPGLARVSGSTRYATAAETCASAFPDGADVVVIASGMNFPDALSASGLAGAYGAPLLLTHRDYLPAETRDEIVRLGATRAFVIGAEGAITPAVFDAIDALVSTTPVRLGGADRYATAAAVVRQVRLRRGRRDMVTPDRVGFVARDDSFPDALSLAPLAWQEEAPIYLVKPTELPAATADVLAEYTPDALLIAGGQSAVSDTVAAAVDAYTPTERAFGTSRYGTAVAIAQWGVLHGSATWDYIGIATGETFPDALAGGVAAGSADGVLLLTRKYSLAAETEAAVSAHVDEATVGRVFGGTMAVSAPVFDAIGVHFGLVEG